MQVTKQQCLRVLFEHQEQPRSFRFYSILAEQGIQSTDLITYESLILAGGMIATYEHRPDVQEDAIAIINYEWKNIAYVTIEGEIICRREAYGLPMISHNDALFIQNSYAQIVEDELVAQKNGREVRLPDLSESDAGGLLQGYKAYWEQYKKENQL